MQVDGRDLRRTEFLGKRGEHWRESLLALRRRIGLPEERWTLHLRLEPAPPPSLAWLSSLHVEGFELALHFHARDLTPRTSVLLHQLRPLVRACIYLHFPDEYPFYTSFLENFYLPGISKYFYLEFWEANYEQFGAEDLSLLTHVAPAALSLCILHQAGGHPPVTFDLPPEVLATPRSWVKPSLHAVLDERPSPSYPQHFTCALQRRLYLEDGKAYACPLGAPILSLEEVPGNSIFASNYNELEAFKPQCTHPCARHYEAETLPIVLPSPPLSEKPGGLRPRHSPWRTMHLGERLVLADRLEQAKRILTQGLEALEVDARAYPTALLAIASGAHAEALALLENLSKTRDPRVLVLRGCCRLHLRETTLATLDFLAAKHDARVGPLARLGLGNLHLAGGRLPEAEGVLRDWQPPTYLRPMCAALRACVALLGGERPTPLPSCKDPYPQALVDATRLYLNGFPVPAELGRGRLLRPFLLDSPPPVSQSSEEGKT
ncbi:MAG: hypothetical protein A2284_07615 [Deltaproteobacteria bacterium RIFOXYA12_FULL_61_11]|nr:MAG: hypothetical protein A2284_07615 [Deltaproteobacteria bacterium RIFOXYA12_FULL_61_11]